MALDGTLPIEIRYCVPWSYHGEAVWMATEFFAEGGSKVAITLTPGDAGVLQVFAGEEKVFDKADEGKHPDLTRVKAMRAVIKQKLAAMSRA